MGKQHWVEYHIEEYSKMPSGTALSTNDDDEALILRWVLRIQNE